MLHGAFYTFNIQLIKPTKEILANHLNIVAVYYGNNVKNTSIVRLLEISYVI